MASDTHEAGPSQLSALPMSELLSVLKCPGDGSVLTLQGDRLLSRGGASYEIRGGIPLLYHRHVDLDRVREEETLAVMMRRQPLGDRDRFSLDQWSRSKEELWATVAALLSGRSRQRVLYVGCGYDTGADSLVKMGHFLVNFDLLHVVLAEQAKLQPGAHHVAGDFNEPPFQDGSFDCVVCVDVIHHEYSRVADLLATLCRLVCSDGLIVISDPNSLGLFQLPKTMLLPKQVHAVLRRWYHTLRRSEHRPADYEFPTNPLSIARTLRALGFRQQQMHPQCAYPEVGPRLFRLYAKLARWSSVATYCNYHYLLTARR